MRAMSQFSARGDQAPVAPAFAEAIGQKAKRAYGWTFWACCRLEKAAIPRPVPHTAPMTLFLLRFMFSIKECQ
jgi:hypothetical protein